jgi:predicted O-methyltransferase YrrM
MSRRTGSIDDRVRKYLLDHSLREPAAAAELRAATAKLPHAGMQISPEQGQLMALLVQAIGARRAIEIGTFTGYSALWVALALPADGRLVCCDVSAEWTAVGQPFWEQAGADTLALRVALDAAGRGRADARAEALKRVSSGRLPQPHDVVRRDRALEAPQRELAHRFCLDQVLHCSEQPLRH